jgi:hypothetical protein
MLSCGDHATSITNTYIDIFGQLVDRLQLPLFSFYNSKLSLTIITGATYKRPTLQYSAQLPTAKH